MGNKASTSLSMVEDVSIEEDVSMGEAATAPTKVQAVEKATLAFPGSFSDDLLLSICEQCHLARDLCRLEQVCKVFAAVDGGGLTLSERAASAKLRAQREAAPGSLRPYMKAAHETHKQVLVLLERGLLATGVLHDVPIGVLRKDSGWIEGYRKPYRHRTSDKDIDNAVPAGARFVLLAACNVTGAKSTDSYVSGHAVNGLPDQKALKHAASGAQDADGNFGDALVYSLLAWGSREAVLKTSHESSAFQGGRTTLDMAEHGVHFYRWRDHAMGFSSDPDVFLFYADSGIIRDLPEKKPGDRLSWNLERRSTGGWRAGEAYELGDSNEWFKVLFYRM